MSVVRFNVDECELLVSAFADAEQRLADSVAELSPLVSSARTLLDSGSNLSSDPVAALSEVSQGLRADGRDLDWRLEFVRRMDADAQLVEVANLPEWTWDDAQLWYALSDIDALWAQRNQGHPTQQQQRREEVADRIAELLGTEDPAVIAAVVAGLRNGESVDVAVQRVDQRMHEARYSAAIHEFKDANGLTFVEAEARYLEMQEQIITLIEAGLTPSEAQEAVLTADFFAMTIDEVLAFQALQTHFDVLANPMSRIAGDEPPTDNTYRVGHYPTSNTHRADDNLVNIEDLRLIIESPSHFTDEEVATATQLLDNLDLLRRLDSARDNNQLFDDLDAFGSTEFDDGRISREDIDNFIAKQAINTIVGAHHDDIDTVLGGQQDGFLSQVDFETYLAENRVSLTAAEIQAFETVLSGEFYDKTWLEENKQSIAIFASVVVGTAFTLSTFGGGLFATMLIAGALGAGTAGGTTVAINHFTGNELTDDLVANTALGALGGAAGVGLGSAAPAWNAATTPIGRFAVASGTVSDVTGIVGMGGVDWALDAVPGIDHADLDGLHESAEVISIATGIAGLGAAGIDTIAQRVDTRLASVAAAGMTDAQVADSFVPLGLEHAEALEIVRAQSIAGEAPTFGEELSDLAMRADPTISADRAEAISVLMLTGGTEVPVALTTTNRPLVQLLPAGEEFSHEVSRWMFLDDYLQLADSGNDVFDALSMPYLQHAPEYQPWVISAQAEGATVFTSQVAPTTQMDGLVRTGGGMPQVIVPDPSMFAEAVPYSAPIPRAAPTEFPVREVGNVVHSGMGAPISEAASRVDDAELHLEGVGWDYVDSGAIEFAR